MPADSNHFSYNIVALDATEGVSLTVKVIVFGDVTRRGLCIGMFLGTWSRKLVRGGNLDGSGQHERKGEVG